ncbi:MAG: lytic transglycosylase domain-containing protein [Ruminococcaceae bacterium]|nr:lytic transglycosylase domain-containing protein [Oscillospiraceae bacterium]
MNKSLKAKKSGGAVLIFFMVFSLVAVICVGTVSILKTLYPRHYIEIVEIEGQKNNLSEEFVFAVIKCESGFDVNAVSYLGAKGLMQIMPDTFEWLQWRLGEELPQESIFEPETAIRYGCYLYGYLIEKFGNEETAVAAYHAGDACVEDWLADERYSDDGKTLKDIPYPSTKEYVAKVMRVKNIYQKLYYK